MSVIHLALLTTTLLIKGSFTQDIVPEYENVEENCVGKEDGKYCMRDCFSFLKCTNGTGEVVACPRGQLYNNAVAECVPGPNITPDNFCTDRPDGPYRNPWDCHKFIRCIKGWSHDEDCETGLTYNATTNTCSNDTYTQYCYILGYNDVYSGHDKFYGEQKSNLSTIQMPQKAKITASTTTPQPITVSTTVKPTTTPQPITVSTTVKPTTTSQPITVSTTTTTKTTLFNTPPTKESGVVQPNRIYYEEETCIGLSNGNHCTRDCFTFLICTSGSKQIVDCPTGYVYDPQKQACVSPETVTEENYCVYRPNGIYRNPWDCHSFVQCLQGKFSVEPCDPGLTYVPEHNNCENDTFVQHCHVIEKPSALVPTVGPLTTTKSLPLTTPTTTTTTTTAKPPTTPVTTSTTTTTTTPKKGSGVVQPNRIYYEEESCIGLSNGNHCSRDCFAFLICTNGAKEFVSCPPGRVYDPQQKVCVGAEVVNEENYCIYRPNGIYRNPWDCHSFVQCLQGRFSTELCDQGLTYVAEHNTCENDTFVQHCHVIEKPSGVVPTGTTIHTNTTTTATTTTTTPEPQTSSSDEITPQELLQRLAAGDIPLIDVREPWEIQMEGRIAHSINIPVADIENAFKLSEDEFRSKYNQEKPATSDCRIVFHCKTGVRGRHALNIAKQLGYKCAKNLRGGFEAWKQLYY